MKQLSTFVNRFSLSKLSEVCLWEFPKNVSSISPEWFPSRQHENHRDMLVVFMLDCVDRLVDRWVDPQ